jgi:hypothetical protein
MNNYKVNVSIIGNRDCVEATSFSTSVKKALASATNKAWELYETSPNTNWSDSWVTIHNPRHKVIFEGFGSDLR